MVQELDIKDMNSFTNYRVLLEDFFFSRYKKVKKNNWLSFLNEEFSIEKVKISNIFFSIIKINYKNQVDLIVEEEIFDIYSKPQLFKLNTKGIIYNFINKSHFSSGFLICLHLTEKTSEVFNFITTIKEINDKYNKPVKFLNKINFLLQVEYELCNKILCDFNKLYESSFSIIENYKQDGESFCIVQLESGSALDIFCLGAFFVSSQKNDNQSDVS